MGPLLEPAAPSGAMKLTMSPLSGESTSDHDYAAIRALEVLTHTHQFGHVFIIHQSQYAQMYVYSTRMSMRTNVVYKCTFIWDNKTKGPKHRTPGLDVPT